MNRVLQIIYFTDKQCSFLQLCYHTYTSFFELKKRTGSELQLLNQRFSSRGHLRCRRGILAHLINHLSFYILYRLSLFQPAILLQLHHQLSCRFSDTHTDCLRYIHIRITLRIKSQSFRKRYH